ncbi:MAG TPA: 50S ribosomal protein L15 [Candidatus Paceibacterota bacterium]
MQIHSIKPKTKNKKSKRVGRGGVRGKTAGRGTKGQKARSGHKIRPEIRDLIKKLPKRRGYSEPRVYLSKVPVNVGDLEKNFSSGDVVTPAILAEKGVIRRRNGKVPEVKILGTGELTKKLIITGAMVSKSAKEKIEKVGGEVKV